MSLLDKISSLIPYSLNLIRVFYVKYLLKDRFSVGKIPQLKNTSRINIFDKNGKIIIGDYFSMGYNTELYAWKEKIQIGSGTSLNDNCKIYGNVSIGSNCLFASEIFISSGTHTFAHLPALPIKAQDKLVSSSKAIVIEDDCWIGFGVVIMPGVYIGKGAVIGSNSVVTKNVFPYTIYGGVPGREIGKRLDFNQAYQQLESGIAEHWPFFYRGCNYRQFDNQDSLNDGLELEAVSMFLFTKSPDRKLKIAGFCAQKMRVSVFLNAEAGAELQLEEGPFELEVKLENAGSSVPDGFSQLSPEIKEKFNVITLQADQINGSAASKYIWKINSAGLSL